MLKFASAIAVAFLLLLAELVTASPKAAALSGILGVQPGSSYSLMQKANCDEADQLCEKGREISCTKGDTGPECACLECGSGEHPVCPDPHNCAPKDMCKPCGGVMTCCKICTTSGGKTTCR
jgi:hypothetical protein